MSRSVAVYVADVLDMMGAAERFVDAMTAEGFSEDERTQFAVVRALEVMGEAAKQVPPAVRERAPSVPWRATAGMRDRLIHDYRNVDVRLAWRTIREDFPTVRPVLERLLADLDAEADGAPPGS